MKAYYLETWGVFIGWAVPCMGGLLVKTPTGRIGWTWGYQGARQAIEDVENEVH